MNRDEKLAKKAKEIQKELEEWATNEFSLGAGESIECTILLRHSPWVNVKVAEQIGMPHNLTVANWERIRNLPFNHEQRLIIEAFKNKSEKWVHREDLGKIINDSAEKAEKVISQINSFFEKHSLSNYYITHPIRGRFREANYLLINQNNPRIR